jgi:enterochelin esterase-like enzyme
MRPLYVLFCCALCASLAACTPQSLPFATTPNVVHAAIAETVTATQLPTAWPAPSQTPAPAVARPSETPTPTATVLLSGPTQVDPPTQTPPFPLTATRVATPTATPCADSSGIVATVSITPTTLHYPLDARIYLPPCYGVSDQRYPVLYLLHGLNNTENQWIQLGVVTTTDTLIQAGAIAPLIIVMPRDRLDSRFDPAVVDDLLPYVDRNYRTLADRQYRAIGGLSRGGGWAVHIGLHYPNLFSRIGAHSPAIFYGDDINIRDWAWHWPPGQSLEVYIDIGDNDSILNSAHWLDQILTWYKIKHTLIVQPGAHVAAYWSAHLSDYMLFYAAGWRHLPAPTPASPGAFVSK